ncbi:hypothetical protein PC129_g6355 [Phytophthora cactorum]|uniref:Retrovirus-related Pol polyprotein from transposon TNT 1-94-like beta-barrel domain-containing protein n=1 Tax=Phytophthora cactorum TaxID=29920 RepID=A0A8T1DPX9_9STRA|nr:hypothetical protein PC117_g9343 [Phytophthora cactorum]KAG3222949.1 hypothetical protein PC129_g6355 [Phytophthora cactorum]
MEAEEEETGAEKITLRREGTHTTQDLATALSKVQKREKYAAVSRMTNIPVRTLFKKAKDQREGKSLAGGRRGIKPALPPELKAEQLAHFAQSWELEPTRYRNLGREVVATVSRVLDRTLAVNEASGRSDEFWILDSGSSRHLVSNKSWLEEVEDCKDMCVQPNGAALNVMKKGTLTLKVTARGVEQTLELTDVYYAEGAEVASEVIMGALVEEAERPTIESQDVQQGTLVEFHPSLGHPNYDAIEKLARDPSTGVVVTDRRRVNCLTCAEGKQTKPSNLEETRASMRRLIELVE